ncbi:MAG: recombinase, partial [Syntrophomonadaceae bacterium]|nr:recombinase [Syntrophomonadaceae bacterium]
VAGEQAGIDKKHSVMGRILKDVSYLGNDMYPAIIDKETFDKAEEVRNKRAKDLGRVVELAAFTSPPPKDRFKMNKAGSKLPVDPFARAEYLYSLIESEE